MTTEDPRPNIVDLWEEAGGMVFGREDGRGNRQATCVFHDDRDPSASINEDQQVFHCFSCQRGGDAIEFLKEHRGIGIADAFKLAEELAGGSSSAVRAPARPSSGLLSARKGARPGRRNWSPTWKSM